jgi:Fe-S-cluster containining protein
LKVQAVKQIPLRIRRAEDREKKGSHGVWRKEFCSKHLRLLIRTRENASNSLVETLSAREEAISCRPGCSHCCFHYVAVSLAQGILIVDYLYRSKALLKHFVDYFETWRKDGEAIADRIDRIRIRAVMTSVPMDQVMVDTRPLSTQYLDSHIRCPFLIDDKCSIYEVRPMACSSHHSISPPDYCAPGAQQKPLIRHSVPEDQDLIEMMKLADPWLMLYELTLPTMIYKLLTEGSSAVMVEISQYK